MQETIEFGLQVMVIGFAVVMITLYVLYLILTGFSQVFGVKKAAGPATQAPAESVLAEAVAAPVAATVSEQVHSLGEDIVAVLTAAIAACLDAPGKEFTISSIEPVQVNPCPAGYLRTTEWGLAGRKKLMERRQDLFLLRREKRR